MQHGQWPWPAEVAASPRRATLAAVCMDVLHSAGAQRSDSKSCFKATKLFSLCAFSPGRHHHPCPQGSRSRAEQRPPAPQAGWDSKTKGTQHPPGSLSQHSLEASGMSPLTFNGLWTETRIRDLIKIGSQDYYRIKTSLLQISLALCHSCDHGFCPQGKPGEAAT